MTLAIENRLFRKCNYYLLKCVPLCFLLTLQGCSTIEELFSDGPPAAEVPQAPASEDGSELFPPQKDKSGSLSDKIKAPIKALPPNRRIENSSTETKKLPSIELMWQVPSEPVEAYHIYLQGSVMEQNDSSKHFRIPVAALKKEDNPTHGPVYKYQLPAGITSNTIHIRAENSFGLSEPSAPVVVEK